MNISEEYKSLVARREAGEISGETVYRLMEQRAKDEAASAGQPDAWRMFMPIGMNNG